MLEQKLYKITQNYEDARMKIDELNRQNFLLQNKKQDSHSTPVQETFDYCYEFDLLKKRHLELEHSHERLVERHQHDVQLLKVNFSSTSFYLKRKRTNIIFSMN